jgi:hypothetical protein
MIAERIGRTIYLSSLPSKVDGMVIPSTLTITIAYDGNPDCFKAIALDNVVLPAIAEALNRANVKHPCDV